MEQDRYKVTIRCNQCGEKFTLVGRKGKGGHVETGFKQCLCNNKDDFIVSSQVL